MHSGLLEVFFLQKSGQLVEHAGPEDSWSYQTQRLQKWIG